MIALPLILLRRGQKGGQALVESCVVIAIVCLLFFSTFQISQLFASQEVLDYAAGRGARAITVGFNRFMVEKTVLVGAIPNAGRMINPVYQGGPSVEHALETARIPLFLGAEHEGRLQAILDYENWNTINYKKPAVSMGDGTFRYEVDQKVPLSDPFRRAYYAADSVELSGENYLDEHYTLYMETDDGGWR